MNAELAKVGTDVGQAPIQAGLENHAIVGLAEQLLGARNQRIDVVFLVAAVTGVGGQCIANLDRTAAKTVAFAFAQLTRNLDDILALVTVVGRSEEHTSELQSLMRISYAVFCLKKNTNTLSNHDTNTPHPL